MLLFHKQIDCGAFIGAAFLVRLELMNLQSIYPKIARKAIVQYISCRKPVMRMNEPHDPLFAVQRRSGIRNETVYWVLDLLEDAASDSGVLQPSEENKLAIVEAAAMLREGGTVAFPTETVYGLGADARNTAAVEAVFAAKGDRLIIPLSCILPIQVLWTSWLQKCILRLRY